MWNTDPHATNPGEKALHAFTKDPVGPVTPVWPMQALGCIPAGRGELCNHRRRFRSCSHKPRRRNVWESKSRRALFWQAGFSAEETWSLGDLCLQELLISVRDQKYPCGHPWTQASGAWGTAYWNALPVGILVTVCSGVCWVWNLFCCLHRLAKQIKTRCGRVLIQHKASLFYPCLKFLFPFQR